ncbi:MAG TPA: D-amino acid dehydrogenase [Lichenihabitans sp.]|jgi:D-amino-acid dehydrogenase|nr:D-amino acid dehydrogenase [Lichenihabitans sp.]
MDILVLGAGVIGVTTAYFLARDGHRVTVVDRQPAAGLETSFANGSQIAAHGAGPWSAPGVPRNLLRWLGREDAPLLLRPRAIPGLWRWGPQFLRNCTGERWRDNARAIHDLAALSWAELNALVAEHAIAYDEVKRGILVVHRSRTALEEAARTVERNASIGMAQRVLDRDACIAAEPALAPSAGDIVGGIHSPDDQTGDCLKFTQALAEICQRAGVRFLFGREIRSIARDGSVISGVTIDGETLRAERYILCFGSYSAGTAGRLGVRLPIYPVKGYSATVSVDGWNGAPTTSLIDETRKIGFSRLGNRLRMAGTAEFTGFDTQLSEARCATLMDGLRDLFPSFPRERQPTLWTGLRPMTPDGRPLIGRNRIGNLIVNSGHGTLGWTLACGSARLVADIVAERTPAIAIAPYRADRPQ